MTSARLTAVAATSSRTSPGPATGSSTSAGTRTSGSPGVVIVMARTGAACHPPAVWQPAPVDSFYVPLGDDRWSSTPHTTGPWDPRFQHGGPPSALLGRAVERCSPRDDMVV